MCYLYYQGGITGEAIDEPRKSSKYIDKRVIINFREKNVVIARFCDKNEFLFYLLMCVYINIYDSLSDVGEIRVYQRADFQSGSRVLKKVF